MATGGDTQPGQTIPRATAAATGDFVTDGVEYSGWLTTIPLINPQLSVAGNVSFTEQPQVTLNLSCLNAVEYRLAENDNFTGVAFQPMVASVPFTLSSGDGIKQISVQYRSTDGGLATAAMPNGILYDTQGPTLAFFFNLITVLFSRADFYIGVKPFPNVTVPLLIVKCLRKKKIVVHIDDVDHLYFTGIPSRIICLSQRFMPRFFDMVTTHNSLLEEYIVSNFRVKRQKMYLLEQGVDTSIFAPSPEKTETDGLAYVAHLNKAADLEPILKAVAIVQQKRNVSFTVIGGGPHEQYFKSLAAASGVRPGSPVCCHIIWLHKKLYGPISVWCIMSKKRLTGIDAL